MSTDAVYPLSIPSCPFYNDVEFEAARSMSKIGRSMCPIVALGNSWFGPRSSKLFYVNSESIPKFEVRMKLIGFN